MQSLFGVRGERSSKSLGDQGKHHGRNRCGGQSLVRYHYRPRRKGNRTEKLEACSPCVKIVTYKSGK